VAEAPRALQIAPAAGAEVPESEPHAKRAAAAAEPARVEAAKAAESARDAAVAASDSLLADDPTDGDAPNTTAAAGSAK
jgi:hypothetical protein